MCEKFVYIVCLIGIISIVVLCEETIEGNGPLFNCDNETDCETFGSTEIAETVFEILNGDKISSVNVSTVSSIASTTPSSSGTRAQAISNVLSRSRNEGEICSCDLTVYSCDINCCCDIDCDGVDVEKLFDCKDNRLRITGTRYCYDGNYISENKTRYLLEKLRDNLFCIAYENLPPVQTTDYDPIINNRITLDEIVRDNRKSRFKWEERATYIPTQFPNDKPYRYGDIIWKMRNRLVKKLELPQTGFTGLCSFEKSLKYLENWSHSCLQISLENNNDNLFIERFNNFSVIASPHFYNDLNFTAENQICPTNVCLPLESHYCFDSWDNCINNDTVTPPIGYCENGSCSNVVKNVLYVITHSGLKGINGLKVYIELGNVSGKFYQKFDVEYKWLSENESAVYHLSGNPGYVFGKHIVMGNLFTNKTGGQDRSYFEVDETKRYLSLPVASNNGLCDNNRRYDINFGEDLKLNCKIELVIENLNSSSCIDLQKLVIDKLLNKILYNVTYVAKLNYYIGKNETIEDWAKILFDRIPENVLTGQIIDDRIICSGLVTSLRVDVVHRRLPEPQPVDNYKILGIAFTFSEDEDIYWGKCNGYKCKDLLSVDVVSYVIFHDVSKPSKYFFSEGPNLDISLPNDFFYPFINDAKAAATSFIRSHKIVLIIYCIFILFR